MIVHADIYDAFADRFTSAMLAVTLGDPTDPANTMGPLSSIEQRDTLMAQLAEARAAGATLVGGELVGGKGAYVTAGVITDLPRDSALAREELFGPVAMLFRAADLDDVIALANDIPFGLGSSVWTTDPADQVRFIADLEAGMIAINQVLASTPAAPFGGIKTSGHGRELGEWGLREFMNVKAVMG